MPYEYTKKQPSEFLEAAKLAPTFAKYMAAKGYHPVPLNPGSAVPAVKWKDYEFDPDNAEKDFGGGRGIALKLGPDLLVDVDLDCPEAIALAPYFLQKTGFVFGRKSALASHYVYRVHKELSKKSFQVNLLGESEMLVEFRAGNNLVTTPPTIHHKTGEARVFDFKATGTPTPIDGGKLLDTTKKLATAALLAKVWPKTTGSRQQIALALAGGMIAADIDKEWAKYFIVAIATTADDEEAQKRGDVVADTALKYENGDHIAGWPTLVELLGDVGETVVSKCKDWLGLNSKPGGVDKPSKHTGKLVTVKLSDIKAEPVNWLWPGWIAYGALSILDGDPDLGKTTISLDIGARVTRGKHMPLGAEVEPGNVLFVGTEDDPSHTLKPRLLAANADMERVLYSTVVSFFGGGESMLSIKRDVQSIQDEIIASSIRLIIFDPLLQFLGDNVNPHLDQDIRIALSPLVQAIRDTEVAVIGIRHLKKGEVSKSIDKGIGSKGIAAVARSVMMVGPSPNDQNTKVLVSVKNNLGPRPDSLSYRFVKKTVDCDSGASVPMVAIDWLGPIAVSADDLAMPQKHPIKQSEAMDFISDALAHGHVPASEMYEMGKKAGHAQKTLKKAADKLGVKTEQVHKNGTVHHWSWSLPTSAGENAGAIIHH